jgi:hypothetical protein
MKRKVKKVVDDHNELYTYSGDQIHELEGTKVPTFLKWVYALLPILGLIAWYKFWNGSEGWMDRNHWKQLQQAARTTFPFEKPESPQEKAYIKSLEQPETSNH